MADSRFAPHNGMAVSEGGRRVSRRKFAELLDALIYAVARDATPCEDGGFGEYQEEKAAVLNAFNDDR